MECLALLLLIVLMSYVFFRQGKPGLSLSILPLVLAPGSYLLGIPFSKLIADQFSVSRPMTHVFFIIAGATTACCFFGFMATKIHKRSNKTAYGILCTGFTVVFAWVMILSILRPFISM